MDIARQQIKKNAPAAIVQQTLRTLMTLPAPLARMAVQDASKPIGGQKKWIKRIDNEYWKGAIIAPDAKKDTEQSVINRVKNADLVIYEIHGGGFRVGHCVMYMDAFISWLTVLKQNHGVDAVIMSVEYSLAPKTCYPAPVMESVSTYQYLTSTLGVSPSKIIVSGDSAGGIIALEMLCHVYAPGLLINPHAKRTNFDIDLPAGILLSSPVVSVNQTSDSWKKYANTDIVSHKLFKLVIKEYIALKKNQLDSMAMLTLFNNLSQGGMEHICQGTMLFFVGEKEVFRDDILAFAAMVKKTAKVKVNICKAHYAHDWYLVREIVRQEDKHMLKRCDDITAKWCDRAVKHHLGLKQQEQQQHQLHLQQTYQPLESKEDSFEISESVPAPSDEKVMPTLTPAQNINSTLVLA
ncbi:Alpha/Beta hydrolase protein [Chlamydoabsidia padenii]|nr:Alpha/Beta hydrolase protein [Chlamydoabsidia padenii]